MTDNSHLDLEKSYAAILKAARAKRFISYGDLAAASGVSWPRARYLMPYHLGRLVTIASERGWPMPSAIIVKGNDVETGKLEGSSRDGFLAAARQTGHEVADPEQFVKQQQEAVFEWAPNAPDKIGLIENGGNETNGQGPNFILKTSNEIPLELEDEHEAISEGETPTSYTVDHIIGDGCFLPRSTIVTMLGRLADKKNVILQGPPGTGKTWLAKRLGYALIGTRDQKAIRQSMRIVQFHPSLSYEDFVRGWRPHSGGGLALIDGIFLKMVQAASVEPDRPFVLIIEEINRGNPAQVFGEMLTLLEDSKRHPDEAVELAYHHAEDENERFYIPPNLHVIGTMNIADRSLALVDLALRRRFAFVRLEPALNEAWSDWCSKRSGLDPSFLSLVRERIGSLNKEIAGDRSLGGQFCIGHSYVTPRDGVTITDQGEWFRNIVETEIVPLLEEYWFDAPSKASEAATRLLADMSG